MHGHAFPAACINRCEGAACTSQMLPRALIFERPGRWSLMYLRGSHTLIFSQPFAHACCGRSKHARPPPSPEASRRQAASGRPLRRCIRFPPAAGGRQLPAAARPHATSRQQDARRRPPVCPAHRTIPRRGRRRPLPLPPSPPRQPGSTMTPA
jgi:hypothetical protein